MSESGHPFVMDPRKRAMIRVLLQERLIPMAVADINAALAAADAVDPLRGVATEPVLVADWAVRALLDMCRTEDAELVCRPVTQVLLLGAMGVLKQRGVTTTNLVTILREYADVLERDAAA
jgi:hypothetical protein